MIAVDTNVLLRYLLDDDVVQSKKAKSLILGKEPVLVTDVVLVETVWTLKGARYKLDKNGIIQVVNALFEEPNICFEDGQTIWRAMNDYRKAESIKVKGKRKQADFPDALIVNKSKYQAKKTDTPLSGVFTFDVAAQQISGTKKP